MSMISALLQAQYELGEDDAAVGTLRKLLAKYAEAHNPGGLLHEQSGPNNGSVRSGRLFLTRGRPMR